MKKKWLVWIFCMVSAAALGLSMVGLWVRQPDMIRPQTSVSPSKPPSEDLRSPEPSQGSELQEEPEASEPLLPAGDRREGIYTLLLVGTSDNYSSDTIMVLSMDVQEREMHLVSIPRDTKVNAERSLKKINGALGAGGMELLKKEVTSLVGFAPDFTVKIELEGLIELVDEIGGIDFDVPQKMDYDDPAQNLHIHFEPGLQHLDGQKAMELLRFRGYIGADIRRMQTQQEFLMAVAKKLLAPANLWNIQDLARIYAENVETNLTAGNLVWFGARAAAIGSENFFTHTLPTYTADASVNPHYYQFVSTRDALELISQTINPFHEAITRANVKHPQFVASASSKVILHGTDTSP